MSITERNEWYKLADESRWYNLESIVNAVAEIGDIGATPWHVCDKCGDPLIDRAYQFELAHLDLCDDAFCFYPSDNSAREYCENCS